MFFRFQLLLRVLMLHFALLGNLFFLISPFKTNTLHNMRDSHLFMRCTRGHWFDWFLLHLLLSLPLPPLYFFFNLTLLFLMSRLLLFCLALQGSLTAALHLFETSCLFIIFLLLLNSRSVSPHPYEMEDILSWQPQLPFV